MIVFNSIGRPGASPTLVATFDVVHPATEQVVHRVQRSTMDDITLAVDTCFKARDSWSSTPVRDRCAIIRKAAELLEDPSSGWSEKLNKCNIAETSVTEWWSRLQLANAIPYLRVLADATERVLRPRTVKDGMTEIERRPWGVCLAIPAWNAAHALTSRAMITPLIAGNTVVLKTSEIVPQTQSLWAELLYASGLPRECLSVIHVAPQDAPVVLPAIVADPRIRHINFTGSTRVGSILASQAGQHLKPILAELGGKAPVLLMLDADLEVAASHIVLGSWMNAGQICMSTEKVFVPESRYDELCRALRTSWASISKNGAKALYSQDSGERVRRLVKDALKEGATSVLEPAAQEDGALGAFVKPTILGPGRSSMRLYREESFGPVSLIVPVPDAQSTEDELINKMVALANDSEYGLSAAVWTRDITKAKAVAGRLEFGAIHINGSTCHDLPEVPHGGCKSSGWGRFNGADGIEAFTQIRTIELPDEGPQPLDLTPFQL